MEVIVTKHKDCFKTGARVMIKTHRAKEGGSNFRDKKRKKYITTGIKNYNEKFDNMLLDLKQGERIYSSVNERNIEKAIKTFKYKQLDSDYYSIPDKYSFYLDIYNRWVSSIATKSSKKQSYFLVDCDFEEGDNETEILKLLLKKTKIISKYKTKNGMHFITEPFNYIKVSFKNKINTDGMLLCAFTK